MESRHNISQSDREAKPRLFTPVAKAGNEAADLGSTEQIASTGIKIKESEFYEPFAEWLKNDLDEVTEVASLGGAGLKSKWGTPDVVGIYKPLASNLIKFSIEILSAEIKIDPQAPVVAFGQAVAYRLFSTKTYIAMPRTLTEEDQSRLESLCMLFGVGLMLFDLNKDAPQFSIRVSAERFSPDMFYVNEFADRLKHYDAAIFEELFGQVNRRRRVRVLLECDSVARDHGPVEGQPGLRTSTSR
jgi:hypothetical protein